MLTHWDQNGRKRDGGGAPWLTPSCLSETLVGLGVHVTADKLAVDNSSKTPLVHGHIVNTGVLRFSLLVTVSVALATFGVSDL